MASIIRLRVSVAKSDLPVINALRGLVNSHPVTLDGHVLAPWELRFAGFVGSLDVATMLYAGHYQFEPQAAPDECCDDKQADFNRLPGLAGDGRSVDDSPDNEPTELE